jgi:hypothetical protein
MADRDERPTLAIGESSHHFMQRMDRYERPWAYLNELPYAPPSVESIRDEPQLDGHFLGAKGFLSEQQRAVLEVDHLFRSLYPGRDDVTLHGHFAARGVTPAELDRMSLTEVARLLRKEAASNDTKAQDPVERGNGKVLSPEIDNVPDPEEGLVRKVKGNSRKLLLYMWKRGNVNRDELRPVLSAGRQKKTKPVSDRAIDDAIDYLSVKLSEAHLTSTVINKSGGLYCLCHPQKDGPQN